MIPFAVVGSDQEYQVNGRRILGRKTKWGTIEGTLSLFPYLLSPPPYPDRTTRTPKPPVQVKVYIVLPCSSKENHFPGVRTENTLSNAPASNSWAFVQLGGLLSAGGDTCGCLVAWLLLAAQLKCLTAVFECSADVSVSLSLSWASGGLCTLHQALGWCPCGISFFFHLHPITVFLFNPPF